MEAVAVAGPRPPTSSSPSPGTLTQTQSAASHLPPPPPASHSVNDDYGDFTFTTVSEAETEAWRSWKNVSNYMLLKQSPIVDSEAVEKESEDPYKDFRHSMLQMIFEKEMCSESDLEELLEAFLQLNSPRQHDVIVRAFKEICQDAFPASDTGKKKTNKSKGD